MPRRAARPNSAGSLHICKPEMSGVSGVPCREENTDEPKVVVQQLPAVEPTEGASERLVPAPYTPAPLDKKEPGVAEVRTRLRPHRSSWRDRFSPPEKKELVKASNLAGNKTSKPDSPVCGKAKGSPENNLNASRTKLVSSTAVRQKFENYPSEDIACIQRNSKRGLKRERTPSTDSAPEIFVPEKKKRSISNLKKRGRPSLGASKAASTDTKKVVGTSETAPKLLNRLSQETKQKNSTPLTTQQSDRQSLGGNKVKSQELTVQHPTLDTKKLVNSRIEKKRVNPRSLRPPMSQSDSPGYCDACQQEFVYLQWHRQTKHKIVPEESTLVASKPKYTATGRYKSTGRAKKCVSNSGESMVTPPVGDEDRSGEAERIARTVQGDVLIQQFGVRLLGMSLSPQQKVLAVAARMVELVRLLRAAQGLEPGVQSLTHLLHTQHWPLITESILYVAGFQQHDGSFRNPAFVFDIGQALKFCAYILKNEAAMNMNQPYEQQLKEFMNSIDGKINEILPESFELRHMLETEDNLPDKTVTEKSEEITTQATQALLSNFNENAQSSTQVLNTEEILPDLLDVSEIGQVTDSPDFVAASELVAMTSKSQESPEKGEGERQASLLLGLSKAFTSSISETKTPTVQPEICMPEFVNTSIAGQTHHESNLDSCESSSDDIKLSAANSNLLLGVNDTSKSASTKVRFVKIVSANSKTTLGQLNKRKFCLLIPSQAVQNKARNECEPSSLQADDPLQALSEVHSESEAEGIRVLQTSGAQLELDATCAMPENTGSTLSGSEDGLVMASQPGVSELAELGMASSLQLEPRQSLANLCGLNLEVEET